MAHGLNKKYGRIMCTLNKKGMNAMMFNTGDLILDAVILSIVARTPEGTYGYKITQDVRSKMDVPESTFYPLLKQMQMDGYLEVYHKDFGGRSRRFYKITESGRERLDFCQQNWTNYLQNASTLLMGGNAAEGSSEPAMQAQPSQMPPQPAPQAQAVQPAAGGNQMDFSIGGDEPTASADGDLFEFETFKAEPVVQNTEPVAEQPIVYEEPVVVEQTVAYEEPAAVEQTVTYEEPAAAEQTVAYEEPVAVEQPAATEIPANDEDDFFAEMAMGDAGEEIPTEAVADQPEETELGIDGIENTFAQSAEISELEDLISQLRSFEKMMSHPIEDTAASKTDSETVAIKDVTGVASLLSTAPAAPAGTNQSAVQNQNAAASAQASKSDQGSTIRYKEVRNPDTDDSVNSLVDLLKDDQPKKKSRFFGWGSKKSSGAAQYAASSDSALKPAPAPKAEPVPARSVEKTPVPAPSMSRQSDHRPENNSTANTYSNLQNTVPAANRQVQTPIPAQPVSARPVAKQVVHEVEENHSVDSLVELLKDEPKTKNVSIFGKASAKSYTTTKQNLPADDTAAIPKPSVSEPKVFKPTASKTFEEKAASPNARPVETTATITKSLDAKAISTKPTAAKPAEAKSVETKAVVTPKAEPAPAPAAEAPMDDFKARLMQAHLIPDEK